MLATLDRPARDSQRTVKLLLTLHNLMTKCSTCRQGSMPCHRQFGAPQKSAPAGLVLQSRMRQSGR